MKRLSLLLVNFVQWTSFALWSFFWMSAAILYSLIFRRDQDTVLTWARRYWGRGLVWVGRCQLKVHPGFIPEPGKPYIFAMNHQSLFDIVVAFVAIPVNIRFIAKKSLRFIPFLGWYMSLTGMIFLDRKNHAEAVRSLDEACDKVRNGASILVYPEGTRSRDGRVMPFKKGPFVMAIQSGVPIVPVAIEGCSNLLERDSMRVKGGHVDIVLGRPIPTAGLTGKDRDALMQRVRDALIDLHLSIGGRGGDRTTSLADADTSSSGSISALSRSEELAQARDAV